MRNHTFCFVKPYLWGGERYGFATQYHTLGVAVKIYPTFYPFILAVCWVVEGGLPGYTIGRLMPLIFW